MTRNPTPDAEVARQEPAETASRRIAICIATYRRPRQLRQLLLGVDKLEVPADCELEVRVVDNDAERAGHIVVDEFRAMNARGFAAHYLVEPQRNIAAARNRALDIGPADLVVFIDDDEIPTPEWLVRLYAMFNHLPADAVFGSVVATMPDGSPCWLARGGFLDKLTRADGAVLHWTETRTSNAMVRGAWFFERGLRFSPRFGRSGGEDSELFRRMARGGAMFRAASTATVWETAHPAQCRVRWLMRRHWRGGLNLERMERDCRQRHPLVRFVGRIGVGTARLGLGLPLALIGRREHAVRGLLDIVRALGGLVGWLRPTTLERSDGYASSGIEPTE